MPKPVWVRVRTENGSHITMTEHQAEAAGYKPLKQPAIGRDGRPLPPKHRVPLGAKSAKNTSTKEASASTESQED